MVFATWVPDTLTRDTFKEAVRLKSSAVFFGGELKKRAAKDGAKNYQGDLDVDAVLEAVSRFERDEIDMASVARLSQVAADVD
mmetsp:Transcript_825/g.2424  ORF Transcript_825/g.2424 Transcript_825/m.2424 type:complete len:83 (-) Transcript_825:90-338(-)